MLGIFSYLKSWIGKNQLRNQIFIFAIEMVLFSQVFLAYLLAPAYQNHFLFQTSSKEDYH